MESGINLVGVAVCGARTPSGPCQHHPAEGRRRCRLHGGALGSGAPFGERNGRYKTGTYTRQAIEERRWVRNVLAGSTALGSDMLDAQLTDPRQGPVEVPKASKRRRVSAQVYRVEGTVHYGVRPPVGVAKSAWVDDLKRALGVGSSAFINASLRRLMAATMLPNQLTPTSTSLSAALALIESMEPANELQAAMAVDVACLHAAASNMLARVSSYGTEGRMKLAATAATRLERAFHSAVICYQRLKHGNRQVIRVERVVIEAGAQAIIGVG